MTNLNDKSIKLGLIILSIRALTVNQSHAAITNFPSHVASDDLKTAQPRTLVWVEKGIHKLNVDSKQVILKSYDPVAYFTQNKAVKGNPRYQSTYQGATYYFSSAAHLSASKRKRSKYVPQYGGFCADKMGNKQLNDSDPSVFFIVNGKLCPVHPVSRKRVSIG